MSMFAPATRKKLKLRMAIDGPSGSGKTYTALRFGFALGKRVVAIDTEHGSMSKYQGESPDGIAWQWQVCELQSFDPQNYTSVMQEARKFRPDVLIIDSLSHAWEGIGGALEQVANSKSANKYTAWKDVTPKHQRMVEAILSFPAHVIVTMRSKMEYILEANERGKMIPRKIGMAPIQRPGMEYEFDLVCEMDWDHTLTVVKTRCSVVDGLRVEKPGPEFMQPVMAWLNSELPPESESAPKGSPGTPDGPAPASFYRQEKGQATILVTESTSAPSSSGELMADAMAPVQSPPDTSQSDLASKAQCDRIKSLAKQLGMKPNGLALILAKRRGVRQTSELTVDEAADIVLAMTRKLQEREVAANPTQPADEIPY